MDGTQLVMFMADIAKNDESFMRLAIGQAAIAEENGDVP